MIRNRGGFRGLRILAVVLAVVALFATACGDDDSESSDETPTDEGTDAGDEGDTDDGDADEGDADEGDTDDEGDMDEGGDAVTIRWFVGLGTGSQAEQQDRQLAVVDAFNESHDDIQLEVEFIDNDNAISILATQISGGNAPDIIGPVGIEGSNSFAGQYLALDDLIESTGFDLSGYDPAQVEFWRDANGDLTSLPFATYPSAIYYNTELFDAAGLPYPPSEYGPDGTAIYGEGTEYEGVWDYAKVEEIAQLLTIDANGLNATEAGFDKDATVQWGYDHQWTEPPRAQGSFFGSGSVVADDGTADFPDHWVEEWKWYHNAIHGLGITPDQVEQDGDVLGGDNTFATGLVAMANTHLWYTCCVTDADGNGLTFWDYAIVPSYEGNVVSKLHADTFRIHADTEHPEEAFEVLTYFQTEAMLDLLDVYGGMPPRAELQADYFANLDENFTQGVNWDVIIAGQAYPDNPSHEALLPDPHTESLLLIQELEGLIKGDPALDIDAWVADTEAALDALWGVG